MDPEQNNSKAFSDLKIACVSNEHFGVHVDEVRRVGASNPVSEVANQMLTAEIDAAIFVTGVGVGEFIEQASRTVDRQRLIDSLSDMTTIAGSAAAGKALVLVGIDPTLQVDSADSWRDILMSLDRKRPVVNQTVALEESAAVFGLIGGLEARGARVVRVTIFPQSLPARPEPIIDFFEQIEAGDFHAILIPTAEIATRYCFLAKHFGRARLTSHLLDNHIVMSIGDDPAEILRDNGVSVDFVTQTDQVSQAVEEIADKIQQIKKQKTIIRTNDYSN